MKHTTRADFASAPYFEISGWTTVYSNDEGRPNSGWYEFALQSPFEYDGTSNLIVDFSHNNDSGGTDGYCMVSETYERRVRIGYSNSGHGDPLDWNDYTFYPYTPYYATAVPNIRLKSEAGGEPIVGDFVQNCSVDMVDLAVFCSAWLSSIGEAEWCGQCDISAIPDEFINELDFAPFASHWGRTAE